MCPNTLPQMNSIVSSVLMYTDLNILMQYIQYIVFFAVSSVAHTKKERQSLKMYENMENIILFLKAQLNSFWQWPSS